MRSPVLIAEIPNPAGPGPRYFAPPGRGVDSVLASNYTAQARQTADDIEEIEGEDYLAVRLRATDESAGPDGSLYLVLVGVEVDRLSGQERDEILDQLRERAEVLGDAVAALDWETLAAAEVVELPELDEWHEAGWDLLPRAGFWANGSFGPPSAAESESSAPTEEKQDWMDAAETEEPTEPSEERFSEKDVLAGGSTQATESPDHGTTRNDPADRVFTEAALTPPRVVGDTMPVSAGRPTAAQSVSLPDPEPDFIVPATPAVSPRAIDPVQVSAAADRSPALGPPPVSAPVLSAPVPRARSVGWLVFPWAALLFMLTTAYLYVTEFDRTWGQHVTEVTHTRGPTRVVEKPVEVVVERIVEKPVERIVEKPVEKVVEKVVSSASPNSERNFQWSKFAGEYRARMSRNEVTRAGDLLHGWADHLSEWRGAEPPGLAQLRAEYREAVPAKLREWAATRARHDLRFADAYDGLAAFVASPATKTLLDAPKVAALAAGVWTDVREAEDQFHYDRIRTLSGEQPTADDRIQQHLTAYLALHDPPGRMLADVQRLVEYRAWVISGKPAKATVRLAWGPQTVPGDHKVELTFGKSPRFTRTITAKPNDTWADAFTVAAEGPLSHRVEIGRATSAVEQLAEAAKTRTELFVLDKAGPVEAADEPESGTKVTVEWSGQLAPPTLPPWKGATPVAPVTLPKKVGP